MDTTERSPATIAAATLSLVNSIAFCALSYAEHGRNLRPSAVLGAYLFFSLLFDIVRIRTLWLIGEDTNLARLFTTSVVLKTGILILEAREKRQYLDDNDRKRGPEELSSIFSQGVFYWLNQLILVGYRKVLSIEDLYPLDDQLKGETLQSKFEKVWSACKRPLPVSSWRLCLLTLSPAVGTSKHRLMFEVGRTFLWALLAPIIPKIVLIGFTFCQPVLLSRFVRFLQEKEHPESINIGYGLIAAYGFAYLGLAVSHHLLSTSFYLTQVTDLERILLPS